MPVKETPLPGRRYRPLELALIVVLALVGFAAPVIWIARGMDHLGELFVALFAIGAACVLVGIVLLVYTATQKTESNWDAKRPGEAREQESGAPGGLNYRGLVWLGLGLYMMAIQLILWLVVLFFPTGSAVSG